MNYQRFTGEQKALTNISLAYRNNPEFRAKIDANPRAIFTDELAECDGEVVIMHNTDEVFYFVLSQNTSQAVGDEDLDNLAAAKLQYSHDTYSDTPGAARQILVDTETGDLYRRYKGNPDDPTGQRHFIRVTEFDTNKTYGKLAVDVGPVVRR